MRAFFVFDVESIGLYGEGFAVAGGVYFDDGTMDKDSEFLFSCPREFALGTDSDMGWVNLNVPPIPITHSAPNGVRDAFWAHWKSFQVKYPQLQMFVECGHPVESKFLRDCVEDGPQDRVWGGPYPLHEISTVMLSAGMDPLASYPRKDREMPPHHPLADARQSARLLVEALSLLQNDKQEQL